MKRLRLPALVAGALAILALLAIAVAFSSAFQTWAARKALAARPDLRATVGFVSAGMKRVTLRDLRFEREGVVLTLPQVEADLPLWSAGWDNRLFVSRLVARGWTLELPNSAATPGSSSGSSAPLVSPASAASSPSSKSSASHTSSHSFAGIFHQLDLPVDLALDGVDLQGTVILPAGRGRVAVTLTGGGLAAGREGRFDLATVATLSDPAVNTVELRGGLVAAMSTPRSFTKFVATLGASARGEKFPDGVQLQADLTASRGAAESDEETYTATIEHRANRLLSLGARFSRSTAKISGDWKIAAHDSDIAPFALGQPLPAFAITGEGKFDTATPATPATPATAGASPGAGAGPLHVIGHIDATVARLEIFRPELAVLGELKLAADFDLAARGETIGVQKLDVAVGAAQQPVATLRALQVFELDRDRGELRTADAAAELLGATLEGVPVEWVKPFLNGLELGPGHLRGEITANVRGGGVALRSTRPLTIDGVTVAHAGKPLLSGVDLSLGLTADFTPRGWQAEIGGLTAKHGEKTLATLDAKAGRLAGEHQALKATGKLVAVLPALLAQPAATGAFSLTTGKATADFVVSLNEKTEVQASVAFQELATLAEGKAVALPAVSSRLRADIAADGAVAFNAPIVFEQADRKSDLTLVGTIAAEKDRQRAIDAELTSGQLVIEDAQLLAGIVPDDSDDSAPSRAAAPPWAGWHGTVNLQLRRIVYSDTFSLNDVTGRLRLDDGALEFEGLQAGLGGGGRANLSGALTFDAAAARPWEWAADVVLKEFDPAPLFTALSEGQPPTVEGKFELTSKVAGTAANLADLAGQANGSLQVTSKGGVFRGLPVNVNLMTETTGKIAALVSSAGAAIGAVTGRKDDETEVANKAQAVAELARGWNPIKYDQLSVVLSRDEALNTTLEDFTLIAPEVRLSGAGTALHKSGASLLDDSLAMEFTLRARGRQGDLLKYLGALEPETDDLGYATCTMPLRVNGTLGKPDTSELNARLTTLALEKSGIGDKAAELLNKIRGGK